MFSESIENNYIVNIIFNTINKLQNNLYANMDTRFFNFVSDTEVFLGYQRSCSQKLVSDEKQIQTLFHNAIAAKSNIKNMNKAKDCFWVNSNDRLVSNIPRTELPFMLPSRDDVSANLSRTEFHYSISLVIGIEITVILAIYLILLPLLAIKKRATQIKKPELVVMFDWDNTIMASADFLREVHVKTAAKLLEEEKIELKSKIPSIATKKKEDILKDLFGEEKLNTVLPVFQEVYDETFKPSELKMLSGAKELLQKLHDANIPVAIISNYTEEGIKQHLDIRNIDRTKMVIVGADTLSHTKPSVEPGLHALAKLKISPNRTTLKVLMIGDGISSDMLFAKNMHEHLNHLRKGSSCSGVLFNSLLSGEPIFGSTEIEKFLSAESKNRATVQGYGGLFVKVKNAISAPITSTELQAQIKRLKPVSS